MVVINYLLTGMILQVFVEYQGLFVVNVYFSWDILQHLMPLCLKKTSLKKHTIPYYWFWDFQSSQFGTQSTCHTNVGHTKTMTYAHMALTTNSHRGTNERMANKPFFLEKRVILIRSSKPWRKSQKISPIIANSYNIPVFKSHQRKTKRKKRNNPLASARNPVNPVSLRLTRVPWLIPFCRIFVPSFLYWIGPSSTGILICKVLELEWKIRLPSTYAISKLQIWT